jgi:NAD(P)H-dependent FMN reductase
MSRAVPRIALVVASTHEPRFADHPFAWLREQLGERDDLELTVIDVREVSLPFYNLPAPPALVRRVYSSEEERALGERLDAADGFLFLVNEYNHGYNAALKNVLDHYFAELEHKPVAFFGYGNVGGARAIEQLRQVVAELNMVSVRETLHIFGIQFPAVREGGPAAEAVFDALEPRLKVMTDHLLWWTNALRTARAEPGEDADAS